MTHIILRILRKQLKPLLQKGNHLSRHLVQLMHITIPIHITKPRPHRIIHKQHIGELVPAALVQPQRPIGVHPIRPDLHHRAVHGTTSRSAVEPDDGALAVGNVAVFVEPEEEGAVM